MDHRDSTKSDGIAVPATVAYGTVDGPAHDEGNKGRFGLGSATREL